MGIANASGLATSLEDGEVMACIGRGALPEGEESVDDALDMMGDDGLDSGLLKKGWVLYCLERFSWLGK
jgi:hypothetical protein